MSTQRMLNYVVFGTCWKRSVCNFQNVQMSSSEPHLRPCQPSADAVWKLSAMPVTQRYANTMDVKLYCVWYMLEKVSLQVSKSSKNQQSSLQVTELSF